MVQLAGLWAHAVWYRRISPAATPHSVPVSFKQLGPLWPRRHNRLAKTDYTFGNMFKLIQAPGKSDSMGERIS